MLSPDFQLHRTKEMEVAARKAIGKDDIYEIHLNGDDGVRLFVDGENILENDGIHGMELITTEKALASGYHKVRLEFFQGVGGSGLVLEFYNQAGKKLDSDDLFYHE